MTPATYRKVHRVRIDVPEPSALVALGSDRFLVLCDATGPYIVSREGQARQLDVGVDGRLMSNLEGVCASPVDAPDLLVLNEGLGAVLQCSVDEQAGTMRVVRHLGTLPGIGRKVNHGWEGLDILPAAHSPDRQTRLIAVHEQKPRRIGIFSYPALQEEAMVALPKVLRRDLSDLSDLAVEPATGHVFLLSDRAERIAETRLVYASGVWDMEVIGISRRMFSRGAKPEGLAFDAEGLLWACTDATHELVARRVVRV